MAGGLVGEAIEERRDEFAEFDVLLFDCESEFNNVIVGDRFAVNVEDGGGGSPIDLLVPLLIFDNPEDGCRDALFVALRK